MRGWMRPGSGCEWLALGFVLAALAVSGSARAATTAATLPTAAAGTNWTNPTSALTNDASYATYTATTQDDLRLTNLGFAIPAGSTINGFTVTLNGLVNSATATVRQVRVGLTQNGTALVGARKTGVTLPQTDGDAPVQGGAADLWGGTWTVAQVNATTFGVLVGDDNTASNSGAPISIDSVTVVVTYTVPAPAEVAATLSVTPQSGSYVDSPMTVTESFTSVTAVTTCQYTLNGGTAWVTAGTVSGTGPYTCTASGITTADGAALTLQMGASNDGGTTWSTVSQSLSRTVDTAPPSGPATASAVGASDTTMTVSWAAATDSGSGLSTATAYSVVRASGATAPADCSGTAVYSGNALTFVDGGLTASTSYSYRVCAYDQFLHVSGGATATGTTLATPPASVAVSNPGQAAAGDVLAGSSALAGRIRMASSPASLELTGLTLSNAGTTQPGYDLVTLQLFEDSNASGAIDLGTDALLGNATWNGAKWAFTGLSWTVPTAGATLLVSAQTSTGATAGRTFTMSVATADVTVETGGTVNAFTAFSGNTLAVVASAAPGGPTGAPMVLLLNPINGAAVSGTFKVQVQAYDGGGIGAVTVQLSTDGGASWGANLPTNANYSVGTDAAVFETTLSLSPGSYTLVARAGDGALTATSARAVVLVDAAGRGDGHLLRRDGSSQLCIDCHALQTHSSQSTSDKYGSWAMGCRDCHTPHGTKNRSLVGEVIQTPVSGAKDVRFTKTTGVTTSTARVDATYVNLNTLDGPCQVCHTKTSGPGGVARFRNTGNADATHYVSPTQPCAGCHQHNKGFSSACNACHNAPPTVGQHGSHDEVPSVNPSYSDVTSHATQTQYGFACGKCHAGTHLNAANAGTPADPMVTEVAFDSTTDPKNPAPAAYAPSTVQTSVEPDGRSFEWSNGTCSSVYCHSNASPAGGTLSYKSPTWNGAVLGCRGCHDAGGAATTLSSAHKIHTGAYAYDCSRCHVGTAAPTNAIADKRLHVDGLKQVGFDATGVNNGGGGTTGAGTALTCSNTYCHSNGQDRTAPYSSGPSIAWGTTADPECDSCHGGNATATSTAGVGPIMSSSHTRHVGSAAGYQYPCGNCHAATVASANDRAILAGGYALHVNGTANVSMATGTWSGTNCNGTYCHGSGAPQWGVTVMDCGSCHSGNSALLGSHAKHYASATLVTGTSAAFGSAGTTYQYGCGYCHPSGPANHAKGAVSTAQAAQVAFSGTLPSGQAVSGTYAPAGTASGADRTFNWSAGTCNSVYCHSNAGPVGGTQLYKPPTWGTTLACNGCHATAARSDSGLLTDLSNAHGKHLQSTLAETGSYAYKCDQCHADTVIANPNNPWALADTDMGNVANHVRGEHTLKFSSSFGGSIDQSAGTYNNVAYTCASTYCHSLGTSTTAPFTAPNTAIAWSATATCTTCHSGDASQTSKIGTTNGSATHAAHVDNAATIGANYFCGDCHMSVVASGTNSPVTAQANHVNGVKDVSIANRGTFSSADTTSTCSSTYCHSSGQATPAYRTITWTSPAIGCNGCHGQGTTTGAPDYPDGATLADANSHSAHVSASTDCEHCHSGFVAAAGTAIPTGTTHTNGVRDVAILAAYDSNGATSNYTQATKTCSAITCHGAGTPVWGDPTTATCLGCHGTSGTETESVGTVVNGTAATINTTEWLYSGHGKTTGSYDVSTNPAAALSTSPTPGKTECLFCHDSGVAHSDPVNPFRLRGGSDVTGATAAYDTIAAPNAPCLNCHATGSFGVDNGGSIKNGTTKPDAAHDGAKHTAATLGGKFCWDCHDPHGDRPSNTNSGGNNIFMIRRSVRADTDGTFGYPLLAGDEKAVEFYELTAAVNRPSAVGRIVETTTALGTQHKGVCQACHAPTTATPFTKYWENTGYDDPDGAGGAAAYASGVTTGTHHNTTTYCVGCHPHAQKFKGGGCNGCHDYDARGATYSGGVWTGGTWGTNYLDGTVQQGWGAHAKHINHLKTRLGIAGTMDPNAATFGVGEAANVCGTCHTNVETGNHDTGGGTVRTINFGDGTFKYGGTTGFDFRFVPTPDPVYNGVSGTSSSVNAKSCANVSCHYVASPVWSPYP